MPKFLTEDELYRLVQREMPPDAYADGAPSAFYTTADNMAFASVVATAYENQERIYDNYFPQTVDEKIEDMEITCFNEISASGFTLQQRRDKIIAKYREQPDLTLWRIQTALLEYLPVGTPVQIIQSYIFFDHWQLDVDELSYNTYLGGAERRVEVDGYDYCGTPQDEDWTYQRETAYGYVVRIFGYTATGLLLQQIERLLLQIEPARSHYLALHQGLDVNDYFLTEIVTPVTKENYIDCIFKNPASSSGYSGRVVP